MSTTSTPRAITSLNFVQAHGDRDVTSARLLHMFDQARRDLAMHIVGQEGMAAGYDQLRVNQEAVASVGVGDLVTVTAILRFGTSRGHVVDYVATSTSSTTGECSHSELISARGWTLTGVGRNRNPSTDHRTEASL